MAPWLPGAAGRPPSAGQCSVPNGLSGVSAIAAGGAQSLALKGDGTVVAWGCSGAGQRAVHRAERPLGRESDRSRLPS